MKYKKSKRYYYFRKQRLYGIGLIVLGVLSAVILAGNIALSMFLVPIGTYLLLSKEMWIMDDYYFEVKDKENRRR